MTVCLASLAPLECLQQIANEKHVRDRLALLGDRVLLLYVSELLLLRYASASASDITLRTFCFANCASHAAFLRTTADAATHFVSAMEGGSDHSLSTHFEAVVGLLYGSGAHHTILNPFVHWCDLHVEAQQSRVSLALVPRSLVDIVLDLDTGRLSWSDSYAQFPHESAVDERLRSAVNLAVRPPTVVTLQTAVAIAQCAGSWQPIVAASTSMSHPAEAVVVVEWRNVKQYRYRDYYFPCCSIFAGTFPNVDDADNTAVAQWLNHVRQSGDCGLFRLSPSLQDAIHPGRLCDIATTGRHGGGVGSHAREQAPRWSCCGWRAGDALPGCQARGGMLVVMATLALPKPIEWELRVGEANDWLPSTAYAGNAAFFLIAESADALVTTAMYVRAKGGSNLTRAPASVRVSHHVIQVGGHQDQVIAALVGTRKL